MGSSDASLAKHFHVTEEKVAQLRKVFAQFDVDGDGAVTQDEIVQAMRQAGKAALAPMVQNIMRVCDKDGDGKMEFREFLAVLAPQFKVEGKKAELMSMFEALDANGDGLVDPAELKDAWDKMGDPISLEEAEAMIAACDKDGDGKATFKEFKKMMKDH